MKKIVSRLLVTLAILATAGCGFHIRSTTTIPDSLKDIHFATSDPYGQFSKMLKKSFRVNNIKVHDDKGNDSLPTFRITRQTFSKDVVSLYQDGKAAEYQLVLDARAEVIMPKIGSYPLAVKIVRSFFDNPARALGKSAEQDLIYKEMRQEAAEKLVRQLITVNAPLQTQPANDAEKEAQLSNAENHASAAQ